ATGGSREEGRVARRPVPVPVPVAVPGIAAGAASPRVRAPCRHARPLRTPVRRGRMGPQGYARGGHAVPPGAHRVIQVGNVRETLMWCDARVTRLSPAHGAEAGGLTGKDGEAEDGQAAG